MFRIKRSNLLQSKEFWNEMTLPPLNNVSHLFRGGRVIQYGADDGTRTRTPVAGTSTSSWPVYLFQHIRKSAWTIIPAIFHLSTKKREFFYFLRQTFDSIYGHAPGNMLEYLQR